MSAQQVVSGVHVVDTYANAIILTDNRLVLIDASSEPSPKKIFDAFQRLGVKPKDLTSIIVTHTHPDHVTGLASIQAWCGAKVAAHEIEAPYVSKEQVYDGPPGAEYQRHQPVRVDAKLKDGQVYDGLLVIHTPGHTRGSMSLLDQQRGLLIAGDAVRTETGRVAPMEDEYNVDPARHRDSIRKLAQLEFETLVCGHGPPISSGAGKQVRELAEQL